ncbi:hypothetical protein [Herbiconiux daphne]|uniref:Integral membrane protein n=1 Tax=Herbiconiux daphne TaxID=2970914 RepID=A0ABT2GYU0_9MICO|nr:hypothetical protein [Herbiconiux daphne]MCS5733102.1 hypothetical protein [Herbiconiux daphne]
MSPRPLFIAAAASYLANCALGAAVAARVIDTRRIRWVHHAVYITTSLLSGAAVSSLLWHRGDNRAAWVLVPAAAPLAAIPRVSARTRGHVLIAATAAPFYAASLVLSRR